MMHDVIVATVMLGLIAFLIYVDREHRKERRDLYNRLMARDFHEFNTAQRGKPPKSDNFLKQSIEEAYRRRMNEFSESE